MIFWIYLLVGLVMADNVKMAFPLFRKLKKEVSRLKETTGDTLKRGKFTLHQKLRKDRLEGPDSTNKKVILVRQQSESLRRYFSTISRMPFIANNKEPYPFDQLNEECQEAVIKLCSWVDQEQCINSVLLIIQNLKHESGVTLPLIHIAGMAVNVYGNQAYHVTNYINRRILNGFGLYSSNGVTEDDYKFIKAQALKLLGNDPAAVELANNEQVAEGLRSFMYSYCQDFEDFVNLTSLLLSYATDLNTRTNNFVLRHEDNQKIWIAAFAALLKMRLKSFKTENGVTIQLSDDNIFSNFYAKGHYAVEFNKSFNQLRQLSINPN